MVQHRSRILVPAALMVTLLAVPSAAGALGMTESYPREIATTGTGEGVRLTRMEASVRPTGGRVRVTVRLAGASTAGTRKLTITVAACTVTKKKYKQPYDAPDAPSRPTCKTGLTSTTVTATTAPFSLTRALTIPRPAANPGALRIRLSAPAGSTKGAPPCTVYNWCSSKRTGDLLLNGNTWKYRPGTWWGITANPPTGVTVDRVEFLSRSGGWVATSAAAAKVLTTWGYVGEPPAKSRTTPLRAGVQKALFRNSTFGGEFETRTTIRVLDYAASINGQRLFTVKLPLPIWKSQYPTR